MLDKPHRPSDEGQTAREFSEDLEPTHETAAEITAGNPTAGSPDMSNLTVTKVMDKSSPILSR